VEGGGSQPRGKRVRRGNRQESFNNGGGKTGQRVAGGQKLRNQLSSNNKEMCKVAISLRRAGKTGRGLSHRK